MLSEETKLLLVLSGETKLLLEPFVQGETNSVSLMQCETN
ncbi:hypothetical protein PF002_g9731 [Phytophthora fragariae]|uniref:Uncharacterized protein n=1 Tax=Phytophthora fragariae TaxID=53985 RepID=A0A6A3ZTB0_9STRA|nr:hypothetical protein PF002_g9731 [Phytophthora fragariae]